MNPNPLCTRIFAGGKLETGSVLGISALTTVLLISYIYYAGLE